MPSVDTQAEARELVATQDTNPLIDLDEMPFDDGTVAAAEPEREHVPA